MRSSDKAIFWRPSLWRPVDGEQLLCYSFQALKSAFLYKTMLVIRLQRVGKKNQASFRVVLQEKSWAAKGKAKELLGFYNPVTKEKTFQTERVKHWLSKGAQASPTVHNMLIDAGIVEGPKVKAWQPKVKEQTDAPAEEKAQEQQAGGEEPPEKKEEAPAAPAEQEEKSVESQTAEEPTPEDAGEEKPVEKDEEPAKDEEKAKEDAGIEEAK